jgi:hypothetical protein
MWQLAAERLVDGGGDDPWTFLVDAFRRCTARGFEALWYAGVFTQSDGGADVVLPLLREWMATDEHAWQVAAARGLGRRGDFTWQTTALERVRALQDTRDQFREGDRHRWLSVLVTAGNAEGLARLAGLMDEASPALHRDILEAAYHVMNERADETLDLLLAHLLDDETPINLVDTGLNHRGWQCVHHRVRDAAALALAARHEHPYDCNAPPEERRLQRAAIRAAHGLDPEPETTSRGPTTRPTVTAVLALVRGEDATAGDVYLHLRRAPTGEVTLEVDADPAQEPPQYRPSFWCIARERRRAWPRDFHQAHEEEEVERAIRTVLTAPRGRDAALWCRTRRR